MKENRLVYQVPGGSPSTSPEGLSEDFEIYTVQSGDTLVGILKGQHGEYPSSIFLDKIAKWNNIKKIKLENGEFDYPLSIDQKIKLPRLENKSPIKFEVKSVLVAEKAEETESSYFNNLNYGPLSMVEGFSSAKLKLSKALDFIETYVTLRNGEKVQLSYDTSWYLALLAKESLFDPNAKSSSGATGYFQILPGAATDVVKTEKDGGIYKVKSNSILKLDKTEYKTDSVANCVCGILYLELLRKNLDLKTNSEYEVFSKEDKDKLAFYAYNKGAGNLKKIYKSCVPRPKNFDGFEKMIINRLAKNINNDSNYEEFTDYNQNYFVEYKSDKRMLEIKKADREMKFLSNENLNHENVIEMLEYYRIIEAIQGGKGFLNRTEYLLKHNIHIVDASKQNSLYNIAKLYPGVSAENIMLANNMTSDKIYSGDKLKIPVDELRIPEGLTVDDVLKNVEL